MEDARSRVVALARSLEGLGGDPSSPRFADYLALIAGGETHTMAIGMSKASGCALTIRGIWRLLGHPDPRLSAPYEIQMAVSDVVGVAKEAGAYRHGFSRPDLGDVVHVGGEGPEHVFTVLDVVDDPYSSGFLVTGLDGGQTDGSGHQLVSILDHVMGDGHDLVVGHVRRSVLGIIDVEKVFSAVA